MSTEATTLVGSALEVPAKAVCSKDCRTDDWAGGLAQLFPSYSSSISSSDSGRGIRMRYLEWYLGI